MPFKVTAKIENRSLLRTLRKLHHLVDEIRNKALRRGAKRGASIILAAAKSMAPVELGTDSLARARAGLLRRSLGTKIKVYPSGRVVAIIGVRRGMKKAIGRRVRGKNKGAIVYYDPAKTAHLVELGTSRSRARPFLRPALDATRGGVVDGMIREIRDTIQRAGERL